MNMEQMAALGWTAEEEKAFADIQAVSRLNRIQAIQIWKRFRKDTAKAIEVAKKTYPPISKAQMESLKKATEVRKARRMTASRSETGRGER